MVMAPLSNDDAGFFSFSFFFAYSPSVCVYLLDMRAIMPVVGVLLVQRAGLCRLTTLDAFSDSINI
jgi:hypothetical protein